MTYNDKKLRLEKWLEEATKKDCMIAFSGGVDSTVLLYMASKGARRNQSRLYAVTLQSDLMAVSEIEQAVQCAHDLMAEHFVLQIENILQKIENNPPQRCYICKYAMFSELKKKADELNVDTLIEGTNADDLKVYRPGIRAVRELGIASPLALCGFTKKEVRLLAEEYGLRSSTKPSMPCMATRFEYGMKLKAEEIALLAKQEEEIRALGFKNFRIRMHEKLIRIECDPDNMDLAVQHRESIISLLECWKKEYIALDLAGFKSGSMDQLLLPKEDAFEE